MTLWFGESWGAPICSDVVHVPTPVGEPCLYCGDPIDASDQGVRMPFADDDGPRLVSAHLECFLQTVLPHGPECTRCRGLERNQHEMSCAYAKHGGDCDCPLGKAAAQLVAGDVSLAAAAESLGMTTAALLDLLQLWSLTRQAVSMAVARGIEKHRRNALKECRRTPDGAPHNPPDDPGKRKA